MKLATYVIGQEDSLEILSQILLGSTDKVETLIQINKLRYPYISDDPIDQYANPKGSVTLVGSYTNPSSVTVSNLSSINILVNDAIFLAEYSSFGSATIAIVNGNILTFNQAIAGTFDVGAVVTLFTNQQNVTTQVLMTGSTLLYPADLSNEIQPNNFSLMLGTDFQLDSKGFLLRSSSGRIAEVSGLANLAQALTMRLQTAIGDLKLHSGYGNKLFTILGEADSTYFIGLAKYYVEECVIQDSRVQSASVTDFSVLNDSIYLRLSIVPVGSQDAISQPIVISIGGVN